MGQSTETSDFLEGQLKEVILFNLYTADFHKIKNNGVQIIQYADDISNIGWYKVLFVMDLVWLKENNFELSLHKTQAIFVDRHSNLSCDSIQLEHTTLPVVSSKRYLRMIVDNKLKLTPQIVKKYGRFLNILRTVTYS